MSGRPRISSAPLDAARSRTKSQQSGHPSFEKTEIWSPSECLPGQKTATDGVDEKGEGGDVREEGVVDEHVKA